MPESTRGDGRPDVGRIVKTLFVSADFKPDRGGIAELYASLLRRFPPGSVEVLTVRSGAPCTETFPHPVHRLPLSFRASSRLPGLVRWTVRARSLARATGARAVQAGTLRPAGAVGAWLRRLEGLPCVVYVHGKDVLKERAKVERSRLYRLVARDVLRNVDAVIANSRFTAEQVAELARAAEAEALADRVRVVLPGADPARFHPGSDGVAAVRERLGLGDRRVVLTVARLEARKGVDRALEAFRVASESGLDLVYVVAGEGPQRAALEARAAHPDLAGRVVFTGDVPDAELPALYRAAELLLLPSRREVGDEVEGFGLVLLEAGASGLPVVAGRSGGVPDAVRDGETGHLVDPESPSAIADALRALLADPARARAMGQRGRERVMRELNWDRAAAEAQRVIEEVVAAKAER